MKKLIVAMAVAAIGLTSNAAAVTWSVSSIQASPDAAASVGMAFYVLDGSTYDTFLALDAGEVASWVVDNKIDNGTTTSSRGSITASKKGGTYAASEQVQSYMVLFNNASAADATYFAYTTVGTATIPGSGSDAAMNFGTFESATATTGGWTAAVPEPTSGLLLLLGIAGLALRRKQA